MALSTCFFSLLLACFLSFQQVSLAAETTGNLTNPLGQKFQISTVSFEKAQKLFQQMAAQKHIPFSYIKEGCQARAHEMAILMEAQKVIVGKIFLTAKGSRTKKGNLRVKTVHGNSANWNFHVAPILFVVENGEKNIYVIDPSIFNEAVPVEDWLHVQTKYVDDSAPLSQQINTDFYFTNRFNYLPRDKFYQINHFEERDLKATKEMFEKILQLNAS